MVSKCTSFIMGEIQNLKHVILKFKTQMQDRLVRIKKHPVEALKIVFSATLATLTIFTAHISLVYSNAAHNVVYEKSGLSKWKQGEKTQTVSVNDIPLDSAYKAGSAVFGDTLSVEAQISEPEVLSTVWAPVTAYSSTPDQTFGDPFTTASGTRVRDGVIAANFLPIGTKVRIPGLFGDKVFVVEDRMNARYWKRLDIWMPTRQDAKNFGIKTVYVEIVD